MASRTEVCGLGLGDPGLGLGLEGPGLGLGQRMLIAWPIGTFILIKSILNLAG